MALLPCLRWDDARWWLPLRSETAEVLAAVMTASGTRGGGDPTRLLTTHLTRDPILLTFVTLRWLAANESRAGKKIRIDRLAKWFRPRITAIFDDGDAFLGQPRVSADVWDRWCELHQRPEGFQPKQFATVAEAWLQIAGPRVPQRWKATWPRPRPPKQAGAADSIESLCDSAASSTGDVDRASDKPACDDWPARGPLRLASLSLPNLARQVNHHDALQERFGVQVRAEKLASLKQFAYGLSHEINNPLANIVTRTQQLQRSEPDERRHESMDRIVGQAMRAHEMISDVMFFAHPPEPKRQRVCLANIVERAMNPFRVRCEEASIELVSTAQRRDSVEVWADPSMLHDAIAALLRNAIEAVGCDGSVRVATGRRGKRQQKAFVQVADSGPGISEEALRHAFDPYYSGREAGRGLGLGLCRVYRIAKQHGGNAKLSRGVGGCVAKLSIRVDGGCAKS